ncbi:restriction endonuclease subunit S [uncultured Christiangramia sp.]|uniref:restriction endonuclease subunit S n=1 Tax=uncultured Christiangramia sp. TaxID=503836 RepID=UPI002628953A|nr:restriction endonuclease subunit S [uncultured Christiangramia sp.]
MEVLKEKVKLQKYPAYKDSGVEWLGEIPEHWNSLPIRAIFEERNEKNDGPKTEFILSVTKDRGVIPYDEKGQIGNNKSEDIERYKVVYPNDFVINKMNVVIGSLGMSKYLGAFSQVYLVYKPKTSSINIEYYSYLFSNPAFYKSLIRYCTGIMELRESLNKTEFKKLVLPFPDYQTQTAIASFLDEKCGRIDTAILQKRKLIELLKERKQILIQKAVTKGLDPYVKMKDSGVEWIGEIPENWELVKNKTLFQESNKPGEEGLPLLMVSIHSAVSSEEINDEDNIRGRVKIEDKTKYKLVVEHDVVFNMMRAWQGAIGAVSVKGLVSPAYIVATPNEKINTKYFEYLYRTSSFIQQMNQNSKGITDFRKRLYWDEFKQLVTVLPNLEEQNHIVEFIDDINKKIENSVSLQEQQIEKLKEYKSSLIDAAVTGKIKVS